MNLLEAPTLVRLLLAVPIRSKLTAAVPQGWYSTTATNKNARGMRDRRLAVAAAIAAMAAATLSSSAASSVVVWGENHAQQTNVPPALQDPIAIAAGAYFCLVLEENGTIT